MEERKKERLISKNGITKEEIEWVIEIKEEVKIGEGEREENEGGIGKRKEKGKFKKAILMEEPEIMVEAKDAIKIKNKKIKKTEINEEMDEAGIKERNKEKGIGRE